MTHDYEPYGIHIAENCRNKQNKISIGIIKTVRSGELRIGEQLLPSTTLATELGVAPNTVLAAYKHLLKLGWVEPMNNSGTYISLSPPWVDCEQKTIFADQLALQLKKESHTCDKRRDDNRYLILGREIDNPIWLQHRSKRLKNVVDKLISRTQQQWNSIAEKDEELMTAAHEMVAYKRKMHVPTSQLALSSLRYTTMFTIFEMLVHRGVTKVF